MYIRQIISQEYLIFLSFFVCVLNELVAGGRKKEGETVLPLLSFELHSLQERRLNIRGEISQTANLHAADI